MQTIISSTATLSNVKISDYLPISGFHNMPNRFYSFDKNKLMEKSIMGDNDVHGFPYINVGISKFGDDNIKIKLKAIIDTGAAHCLLKPSLISQLNLESFGTEEYIHPQNGIQKVGNFSINLFLDTENESGCALIQNVRVSQLDAESYPAEMIIGVELLRHCSFMYNGRENMFQLDIKL